LHTPKFDLKLVKPTLFYTKSGQAKIIQSIFQGALWIIILYNFILFVQVQDKTYLFYVLYTLSYSLYYFAYYDIINESPKGQILVSAVASQTSMLFYFLFMRLFVDAKKILPKWDKVLGAWLKAKVLCIVFLFLYLFFTQNLLLGSIFILGALVLDAIFFVITFMLLLWTRNVLAHYFVTGSFFLVLGLGLSVFGFFDLDNNPWGFERHYFSQAGIFLELVLFSVGLGYRERKNEQAKRFAQEENARILQKQKETLEFKVKERTQAIEKQQEEIEHKNKILSEQHQHIQASIQAGLRIQKAVLPFEERIHKALPEYFVFFRPKAVVSGDFYWFEEVGNYKFIVAADCTGHGISGAFMTMLCSQALTNIIIQRCIYSPDEVLNILDQMLPKILKTPKTLVRDGMDAVICRIDQSEKELQYAGAQNPLLVVQKKELKVILGDKCSINGHRKKGTEVKYTLHTLDIVSPTIIYMYSDGVQDQFGGEKNRKFSAKRLKQLLFEMSHLPMPDQKQLLGQAIDNWQGAYEQIDDMLLIGLRLS
jgi:serine phosphatase RsbU (regulator of sigma subunit)